MRAAARVTIALLLLTVALPVEATPLPQTQDALRTLARESLDDADRDAADALREAQRLVDALRGGGVGGLAPLSNGALQVRMAGAQPVVRDHEDFLSVAWIGAKSDAPWVGAYWIEANGLARSPNLVSVDHEGGLLFLDRGALALPASVDITYHFLGIDGARSSHHAGVSRVLELTPIEERSELGLAIASASGHAPEAILLTPWNTMERAATLGVSYLAGDETIGEILVADCDDLEATTTSAGCRLTYVDALPPALTHIALWHLDADGERVVDVTLGLPALLAGYASGL